MGLDINIKGLAREDTYHGGYIRFGNYRMEVAKAFNKTLGEIYKKPYLTLNYEFTDDEIEQWNQLCNEDLDIFLWHSDCDGRLTPEECKLIYNELNKLNVQDLYYSNKYTMHQLWLNMLQFCYKHRVNMYFY
ncbi:MAG TPA: hypothetical protein OIM60_03480 [Clostridiaceae bacterium]|nr:hypothetical protein [Clostridiaceae bacterium]